MTNLAPTLPDGSEEGRLRLQLARSEGAEASRAELRAELADALGLDAGTALLDQLIDLGIRADLVPAFESLPLLEVAWADGGVDREERWRVLELAHGFGLELGRPAHAQLELWLVRPPEPALYEAWYRYAARVSADPVATWIRGVRRRVRQLSLAKASAGVRETARKVERALDAVPDGL